MGDAGTGRHGRPHRSAAPLVLTLDVGTSSVRALLFDRRRRQVPGSETKIEYTARYGRDGMAEVDAGRLDRMVRTAISRTLATAGRRAEVAAVGVSTFWHGLVGLDAADRPTTPVLLWMDTRSWQQARRLRGEVDWEPIRARTGCPLHPGYWPARLGWLRETAPDVWSRTARWVSFADLLYLRLLGQLGTSPSMASGTGLRRLDGGWDPELLDLLGLRAEQLPPEADELEAARPTWRGWPQLAGARWFTAAGDGALANLGSGCVDETRRALTVGTSGALRVMTDRLPDHLPRGIWCYLLEPGRYVVGGSLSNGGNLYAWLVRTLRVDERHLEGRLRRLPPGGDGLVVLPLLAGERSLGFAEHATGAVAGLTQATTAEEIVHAGLEAVALTFGAVDRALDRCVPGAERLVASGAALVSSRAWAQMMADAIGKPLTVTTSAMEASSAGAAELALMRLGLSTRRRRPEGVGRNVEPRAAAHRAYEDANRRQEWLYTTLIQGSA